MEMVTRMFDLYGHQNVNQIHVWFQWANNIPFILSCYILTLAALQNQNTKEEVQSK